jgi:tyrosyl-tRNA synthetase
MQNKTNQILTRGVEQFLPNTKTFIELMSKRQIRVFLGIDPTSSQLHLGHAVPLRKLQQFVNAGHDVILLVGNATVQIGDPTGRDSSRPMLTMEQIEQNFQNWKAQASKILDFSKITITHNYDWWGKMNFSEMIKIFAKTTLGQLIERDMFQERMKNNLPIHTHEILYPLIQGYDSVAMDVDLEVGGNDQLFNMMMGRTMQKTHNDREKWVMTVPLLEGLDGRKMSKSFGNFVGLTDPANDIYGKLMSMKDEMIATYFEILTDVELTEIKTMQQSMDNGKNPMQFKKRLAFEITKMLHDETLAKKAEENFSKTVQQGQTPESVQEIKISGGITWLEVAKTCLPEESNGALRRLFEQNAVNLEGEKISDSNELSKFNNNQVLKIGKRNYFKLLKQ